MSKVVSFLLAVLVGFGAVSVVEAAPASANYGGCEESPRYAQTYGGFVCAVKDDGEGYKARARWIDGTRFVTLALTHGPEWTVTVNGRVFSKHRAIVEGEPVPGYDFSTVYVEVPRNVTRPQRVTLRRDGAKVYRVVVNVDGVAVKRVWR